MSPHIACAVQCGMESEHSLPVLCSLELLESGEVRARKHPGVGSYCTSTIEGQACFFPSFMDKKEDPGKQEEYH